MASLDECITHMLELNNVKNVIGKELIEIILNGLLSICVYIENPIQDVCLKCPMCNNIISEAIEYPIFGERDMLLFVKKEEVFSENEYLLKILRDTKLKEKLKSRKIKIMSGKHMGKIATLKSWSGTSVKVKIDSVKIAVGITNKICIPDELVCYLTE